MKAVVANVVLLSDDAGVGAVGVPVRAGEASGAFRFSCDTAKLRMLSA
jgi:hypothetical protein